MIDVIAVVLGAALGGPARFLLDRWVQLHLVANHPRRIAVGTLTVNVLGSALMGLAVVRTSGTAQVFLAVGFCGSFTTFSTFAALTDESWREGFRLTALAHVVVSVALCFGAFALVSTLAS